jgi:DnaK suppressor protein
MDGIVLDRIKSLLAVRLADLAARLRAALARIETGDFGYCTECGEAIAAARLEFDPALALCIACARYGDGPVRR